VSREGAHVLVVLDGTRRWNGGVAHPWY
jgi:hypothetical protein